LPVENYETLCLIQGSIGQPTVRLGQKGRCRYCGNNDPRQFRNKSHSFPEGLGNKWIISLDECDKCNAIFSRYDDALAMSIGAILTVGGTQGKGNSVRQTGRTGGSRVVKHGKTADNRRSISVEIRGESFEDRILINPATGRLQITAPLPIERFVPRYAYKALVKMALALLPLEELDKFQRLTEWVRNPKDDIDIPGLIVGLSFGSVGHAPPLVAATILRRREKITKGAYAIFVISIGSVCFQIDLKSDEMDGAWPPQKPTRCHISWTNIIGPSAKNDHRDDVEIRYGQPIHLDWSSPSSQLTPIEALITEFNIHTSAGTITPKFR